MTEEELARYMPLGIEMTTKEIRDRIGDYTISMHSMGAIMRSHMETGFVSRRRRHNRAYQFTRERKPKVEKKVQREGVMTVMIGGSTSSHFGSSDDKPVAVSLPAMPEFKHDTR